MIYDALCGFFVYRRKCYMGVRGVRIFELDFVTPKFLSEPSLLHVQPERSPT